MKGRLIGLVLFALCACSGSKPHRTEQLVHGPWIETAWGYSLRGWMRVIPGSPDTLRLGITVANRSNRTVRYEWEGCPLEVRAYRTADRSGVPAWDSERVGEHPCAGGSRRSLAPGDTLPVADVWVMNIPSSLFLGDSLPEGRYYFSVRPPLEMNPEATGPPLPPERRKPGYRYSPHMRIYLPTGSTVLRR
jgi:hypothetical protein